ncbi:MAG: type II toxin-antitoxin system prevent-host-death family antitoxin [Actinomycetota bacterium]|nr:type II toxin-antitoxin system prevent-host-death family antitoxin [Actinomycetota bacterium]
MNLTEAGANLPELLDAAEAGEEVMITRAGKSVARLVPVTELPKRTPGFRPVEVDDALFEPLTGDDPADWE